MKHQLLKYGLLFLLGIFFTGNVMGQSQSNEKKSEACTGPEFRQFDYWIGEWTVKNMQGNVVGSSKVSRISNGCALLEEWTSAEGNDGKSINFYDSSIGKWRQSWVGGGGLILDLEGALVDGNMTLSQTKESPGGPITHRIRWTLLDGGRVEQRWDTSTDDGETWKQSFIGLYEPKK